MHTLEQHERSSVHLGFEPLTLCLEAKSLTTNPPCSCFYVGYLLNPIIKENLILSCVHAISQAGECMFDVGGPPCDLHTHTSALQYFIISPCYMSLQS